jgi:hypothetical protein
MIIAQEPLNEKPGSNFVDQLMLMQAGMAAN